jgi:hypothetical protein
VSANLVDVPFPSGAGGPSIILPFNILHFFVLGSYLCSKYGTGGEFYLLVNLQGINYLGFKKILSCQIQDIGKNLFDIQHNVLLHPHQSDLGTFEYQLSQVLFSHRFHTEINYDDISVTLYV